jgi:hypothetical protein
MGVRGVTTWNDVGLAFAGPFPTAPHGTRPRGDARGLRIDVRSKSRAGSGSEPSLLRAPVANPPEDLRGRESRVPRYEPQQAQGRGLGAHRRDRLVGELISVHDHQDVMLLQGRHRHEVGCIRHDLIDVGAGIYDRDPFLEVVMGRRLQAATTSSERTATTSRSPNDRAARRSSTWPAWKRSPTRSGVDTFVLPHATLSTLGPYAAGSAVDRPSARGQDLGGAYLGSSRVDGQRGLRYLTSLDELPERFSPRCVVDAPGRAEVAYEVVDGWQGQGCRPAGRHPRGGGGPRVWRSGTPRCCRIAAPASRSCHVTCRACVSGPSRGCSR